MERHSATGCRAPRLPPPQRLVRRLKKLFRMLLRLPLWAVVLATLLTVKSGTGDEPLIIVGVVVSYLITLLLSPKPSGSNAPPASERTAKPARPAAAGAPAENPG